MKVYNRLYAFQIEDAIADGKRVRVLDRETEKVYNASELLAKSLINIIRSKDEMRFEFWCVEESESDDEQ